MKATDFLTVFVLMVLAHQGVSALICFSCQGNVYKCGNDFNNATAIRNCTDVCYKSITVDAFGVESFYRGCGDSEDEFGGEREVCLSTKSVKGASVEKCSCSTEKCNGADTTKTSSFTTSIVFLAAATTFLAKLTGVQ